MRRVHGKPNPNPNPSPTPTPTPRPDPDSDPDPNPNPNSDQDACDEGPYEDIYNENDFAVGTWGGRCMCPSGNIFQVGP